MSRLEALYGTVRNVHLAILTVRGVRLYISTSVSSLVPRG